MEVAFTDKAKEDLEFWKKSGNSSIRSKITKLIESIAITPFEGIGKPEPLKYELTGAWSRRINKEHRIIYEVQSKKVIILSLKGHY
ncbi:MAG: Txe/YoeB family addiction module toxin [Flavipsychrobacter sp.]|jgi:toxin YoeB|nr:Txe/YoeB family addiction module toxin [Flavipsychrobacter sp.]